MKKLALLALLLLAACQSDPQCPSDQVAYVHYNHFMNQGSGGMEIACKKLPWVD